MIRNTPLFTSALVLLCACQFAAGQEIDRTMLKKFKIDSRSQDNTALVNIITNNNISNLVVNRERAGKIDHHFAVRLDIHGITNQHSTGRCWLFTGLNVLRQKVREQYNLDTFEYSENYSFFWDQLEKSNLFLEGIIATRERPLSDRRVEWLLKNTIGDGGVWSMMTGLAEKYGLVPESVMPETYHSKNTGAMSRIIRTKLREDALSLRGMHEAGRSLTDIRGEKTAMLSDIYRILVFHLGEPPEEFTWRYQDKDGAISEPKTWTPLQFYKETVAVDFADYIMLMNDPSKEYFKLYEIDYDRNLMEGDNWTYINLPNDLLKKFAKRSLLAGEAMYFSCDVGKQLDREEGILDVEQYDYESLYGVPFGMDKKQRILSFESGSSHGMALVGVDTTLDGTPTKWLLENSWGAAAGHQGYLTMTDRWFDEYGFRLVVRREFIDADVLKILKQKPVMLDPWDHMF
ncbi:C1 family peptidase [bacterium]|nr:C1 family peptidase [bacterium]